MFKPSIIAAVVLASVVVIPSESYSQIFHFRRACNSCKIRSNVKYSTDNIRTSEKIVAKADLGTEIKVPVNTDEQTGRVVHKLLKRKSFTFDSLAKKVGNTIMSNAGATLTEDGNLAVSGIVTGEKNKLIPRTHVVMRAISSSSNLTNKPLDGAVVFEKKMTINPKSLRNDTFRFENLSASERQKLERLFPQITHLELELGQ